MINVVKIQAGKPWMPDKARVTCSYLADQLYQIAAICLGATGSKVAAALTARSLPPFKCLLINATGGLGLESNLIKQIVAQNKIVLLVGELEGDRLLRSWLDEFCEKLRARGGVSVAIPANQRGAIALGVDLTVKLPAAKANEIIATMVDVCLAVKSIESPYQMIGVDHADFIAVFSGFSNAWTASGSGAGTMRAKEAAVQVATQIRTLSSGTSTAVAVFICISGPADLSLKEISDICQAVQDEVGKDRDVGFSAVKDHGDDVVSVTVIGGN